MAERLLKEALKTEGEALASIEVISAGVSAMDGGLASENSIRALALMGIDLKSFKSRYLTQQIIDSSWMVFGMTKMHVDFIRSSYEIKKLEHLYLMRELMQGAGRDVGILDPIGQDLSAYVACRDNMLEAVPSIISLIKKELELQAQRS